MKTNNIIYNIINNENANNIFIYFLIIIVFIFISMRINFNINIIIGLIFCIIIIYYFYTYNNINSLNKKQLNKEKFDILYTENNILEKYPKIVDLLYYMDNFNLISTIKFNNLKKTFENFCEIYENCIFNNNLIYNNYKKLIDLKITILSIINSYIFDTYGNPYQNILKKNRISAEFIIDEMLNTLILLYKKDIYNNGYNINKNNISYNNILPYNILYDSDYREHYDNLNMANLLFF